jgi:hypothetical protein
MAKTVVSIDDEVLEAGRLCAEARDMTFSAWLTEAARVKSRQENADAYGRWLAPQAGDERAESERLDQLDTATRDGAAW